MDKIDLQNQVETITKIRDRLHANNGKYTNEIEFTINKQEIDALIHVLSAGITYYNFTRALQNDTETTDKELPKPSGNGTQV